MNLGNRSEAKNAGGGERGVLVRIWSLTSDGISGGIEKRHEQTSRRTRSRQNAASWGEVKLREENGEGVKKLGTGGSEGRSRVGRRVLEMDSSQKTTRFHKLLGSGKLKSRKKGIIWEHQRVF